MTQQKTKNTDELFVTIDISLARIFFHSKKIGGILRSEIVDKKSIFTRVRNLVNKLADDEIIEQRLIDICLKDLKELQGSVLLANLKKNPSYSVLIKSFEELVNAFEKLK